MGAFSYFSNAAWEKAQSKAWDQEVVFVQKAPAQLEELSSCGSGICSETCT